MNHWLTKILAGIGSIYLARSLVKWIAERNGAEQPAGELPPAPDWSADTVAETRVTRPVEMEVIDTQPAIVRRPTIREIAKRAPSSIPVRNPLNKTMRWG